MPIAPLNANTVMLFLRERGLLDDAPEASASVTDMTRRNRNFAVWVNGRPAWFVKQAQHAIPEVIASLRREANCYQIAQETAALARLRTLMPRCALFDAENSILVLECLDGVNAAEAHAQVGAFDGRVADILGESLTSLHETSPLALRSTLRTLLPAELPWVLQPATHRDHVSRRSAFLSFFDTEPAIGRAMSELRDRWRRDTLVHGDARLENFFLGRPAGDQVEFDTRLIDWELADVGDAGWDCAGVMQHYWEQWMSTTPGDLESWEKMRGAIERFWAAYAAGRDLDPRPSGPVFRGATRLTGVRLIQTAYEHFARSADSTPMVQRCAQLARLLLTETDNALKGFGMVRHGV